PVLEPHRGPGRDRRIRSVAPQQRGRIRRGQLCRAGRGDRAGAHRSSTVPDTSVRSDIVADVPEARSAAAKKKAPSRVGSPASGRELRARGQRTVRKLLDAGIEVFGTKGYFPARVDDIVKVARTSHGTFYLYFANK